MQLAGLRPLRGVPPLRGSLFSLTVSQHLRAG